MKLRILKAKIASSAPYAMMSVAISQGTLTVATFVPGQAFRFEYAA